MKTKLIPIMILALLSTIFSGCSTQPVESFFPEGHIDKARYTRTGKVSSTTVEADNFVKTNTEVSAERLTLKHSNLWMPNIEISLEGYRRMRKPDEPKAEPVTTPPPPETAVQVAAK